MLDTRLPPTSARPRRSSPSARPERLPARPGASRIQMQAAAREKIHEQPGRRALPSARSSRLSRSEMRLMGIATVCTAVVCALLLLYLAAYAQVAQLGIAQSEARKALHHNQMHCQLLEAERNSLESPQRIEAAAAAEGMVPRGQTPINYIAAQGNSTGGTTKDSRTAASFGH